MWFRADQLRKFSKESAVLVGCCCLFAWIAATFGIAAMSLPLPNIGFAQDIGTMLDGGWRFYQGLRPHADYHTALGPVFGLIFGLPMLIGGPTYGSLRFLPPTISAIVAVWTWLICRRSLTVVSAVCTAVAMGSIAGGIFHIGFQPEALSFATFYNRVGFGILGIVTLGALLPHVPGAVLHGRFLDASVVIGLILLLFLKVTFFLAACPLVLAAVVVNQRRRADWFSVTAMAVLVSSIFLYLVGFRIDLMLSDLWMAAQARKSAASNYCFPLRNALANHDLICLLVLQSLPWLATDGLREWRDWRVVRQLSLLWGPAVLGWTVTLVQSHGDGRGISTALAGLAVSTAWLRTHSDATRALDSVTSSSLSSAGRNRQVDANLLAQVVLVMGSALFIFPHAQSYLFWHAVSAQVGQPQFWTAPLRQLYVGSFVNVMGPECVDKMNDAIALLQRHCKPNDSMQYMDDNNPYGFACGLRTPRKSNMFWETGCSYSRDHHPPANDFDDTDFILVPKPTLKYVPLQTLWKEIYADYIATHFALHEETAYFILYKRKAS